MTAIFSTLFSPRGPTRLTRDCVPVIRHLFFAMIHYTVLYGIFDSIKCAAYLEIMATIVITYIFKGYIK